MENIEDILGYKFNNKHLLQQALTHTSITPHLAENYERLEFLGDRVLGVSVAEMLYRLFPSEPEGSLSQRFVALVCKETVAEIALELRLDHFIHAEGIDVRNNENVLCDVGEAVIGAIFLDAGSVMAIDFVQRHWGPLINTHTTPPKDAKTTLQEFAHGHGWETPRYSEIGREGSEHDPLFLMKVNIKDHGEASGQGHNKKAAEQSAAENLLKQLGVKHGRRK